MGGGGHAVPLEEQLGRVHVAVPVRHRLADPVEEEAVREDRRRRRDREDVDEPQRHAQQDDGREAGAEGAGDQSCDSLPVKSSMSASSTPTITPSPIDAALPLIWAFVWIVPPPSSSWNLTFAFA